MVWDWGAGREDFGFCDGLMGEWVDVVFGKVGCGSGFGFLRTFLVQFKSGRCFWVDGDLMGGGGGCCGEDDWMSWAGWMSWSVGWV